MIPGTVDGRKVEDKRTAIMPSIMIWYYQQKGKWTDITDVRSRIADNGETITIIIDDRVIHTWKYQNKRWRLVKNAVRKVQ